MFALQPLNPIIVRVAEQPVESTSVSDILVGALGLTGVMLGSALLLGVVLGAVMIGVKMLRARAAYNPTSDRDALRVTPGAS